MSYISLYNHSGGERVDTSYTGTSYPYNKYRTHTHTYYTHIVYTYYIFMYIYLRTGNASRVIVFTARDPCGILLCIMYERVFPPTSEYVTCVRRKLYFFSKQSACWIFSFAHTSDLSGVRSILIVRTCPIII